jgi:nitrate/TMAO reductase-like tetraheme cytochrome c subunit
MGKLKESFSSKNPLIRRKVLTGAALVLSFILVGLSFLLAVVTAMDASPALAQGTDNETCLACHSTPGMQTTLPSGETLYLTVDEQVYDASIHGKAGYACTQCHTNISGFPHPPLEVATRRDLTLQLYRSCIQCHEDEYEATLDGVHQVALAGGNTRAAVCTDCHGTHNIGPADQPLSRTSQMCEPCHSQIFELYKESVHGAALVGEGNPDVPSCTDCHQVHSTEGPSTGSFHLFSPQICAHCHADPGLMKRYGINADVFDTYIADFHGTTVVLFQAITPDQKTNKPVCIDCHSVHDIRQVDDPDSTVIKANLLATCQKCHPDATTNFPTSWIGHYRPDLQHTPLVFFVNLFYTILIPTLIGGMVVFVASDAGKRILGRSKEHRHG